LSVLGKEKKRDMDFEVIREPWNKYGLREGPTLSTRFVLLKLHKLEQLKPDGTVEKQGYGVEGQTLQAISNVPEKLKGQADTNAYSPQELQNSIVANDVGVDTLAEEWNDYVAEDGTKIRVKNSVVEVSRTSKFDKNGEPIYLISSSQQVAVKPKKP
jgi:hypothetical protein